MKWIAKKNIDTRIVEELLEEPLKTNQFTNGGINVLKLENFIKDKFRIDNNKSVIVVTNGSVALHSITKGIEYYEKKELQWATQSFTFPPSAQGNLSNVKIIDIDNKGGLDLDKLDSSIHGIIVTNIFGNLVNIEKYESYCKKHNIFLLFDNAATCYSFYNGKNSLNYGNGCTISFHHTKPFGFGEGGAIIVDKKYEENIRKLNNFGIGLTENYYVREGNNNKMSEISAVYILQYLRNNFERIIQHHNTLYNYFKELVIKNNVSDYILFPNYFEHGVISCICILYKNIEKSYKVLKKLQNNNIEARKYYIPLNHDKRSNEFYNKIICIPCNLDISLKDIDNIFKIV